MVYRFDALGEASLHDQRSLREPQMATPQVEAHLLGYLDAGPNDYGWDRANWTLEPLSLQLQADTGVALSCSYVYQLLWRWGCRRGRQFPRRRGRR